MTFPDDMTDEKNSVRVAPDPAAHQVRRRILKGAIAALPSVYTLSSGAQTALGSANCLLHNPPDPMPQRFISGQNHDTWLRQRVVTGNLKGGDKSEVFCVSSSVPPSGGSADDASYWGTCARSNGQAEGTWVRLIDNKPVSVATSDVDPIKSSDYTSAVAADRRYGLVFVNDQGRMETLNPTSGLSDAPITGSCWMSLVP